MAGQIKLCFVFLLVYHFSLVSCRPYNFEFQFSKDSNSSNKDMYRLHVSTSIEDDTGYVDESSKVLLFIVNLFLGIIIILLALLCIVRLWIVCMMKRILKSSNAPAQSHEYPTSYDRQFLQLLFKYLPKEHQLQ